MKVRASFLARLAVYAAALIVLVTARLPDPSTRSTVTALRSPQPAPAIDPVRLVIAGILVTGIVIEVLRRRPVWH